MKIVSGYGTRAGFACDPALSRGRVHGEEEAATRSPFQRDRDRIIHSTAFRRLMHKTQVFVHQEGDHYRTRLTHSLEVAQIARSIARVPGLDEDLTEALALAHDLGHPPFGHAGERALQRVMAGFGGFDHNIQTFRIVTALEAHYGGFDGLNLTLESLEGLVKHNGPFKPGAAVHGMIARLDATHDLFLELHAPAEAQAAALADDIAYNAHDVDDGLRAGLFTMTDLAAVPLAARAADDAVGAFPGLDCGRLAHETVRRLISAMANDVLAQTAQAIARHEPGSISDIRALGEPLVAFSPEMRAGELELKAFLKENMYKHPRVMTKVAAAEKLVAALFSGFHETPAQLPRNWRDGLDELDEKALARRICDFIAGMTDRFALEEYRRIFDAEPEAD